MTTAHSDQIIDSLLRAAAQDCPDPIDHLHRALGLMGIKANTVLSPSLPTATLSAKRARNAWRNWRSAMISAAWWIEGGRYPGHARAVMVAQWNANVPKKDRVSP